MIFAWCPEGDPLLSQSVATCMIAGAGARPNGILSHSYSPDRVQMTKSFLIDSSSMNCV